MSNPVILLVEESPTARKVLRMALESEGCEVIEAGGSTAALEAAEQRRPDFLLLAQNIRDMQAAELLAELRAKAGEPALPALVMTGTLSRLDELGEIARKVTSALKRR